MNLSHHLLPPLGLALATGFLAPYLLGRARWTHQAPPLAAAVWCGLTLAFTASVAMSLVQLILPMDSSHRMLEVLTACMPWSASHHELPSLSQLFSPSGPELAALSAAAAVLLAPGTVFVRELLRARRARRRHAELLRLVGVHEPRLRAVVLEHEVPAVYCLPGRTPQIIVSSGALSTLTAAQLEAALAHERAHISGRHHLLVAASAAFAATFRWLPLARRVRTEVPLLLEMAADDRALRRCSRDALATALYAMAVAQAPREAFAAGGPSAVVRMRRILAPRRRGHPVLHGLFAVFAAAGAVAPLVSACCSVGG